MKQCNHLFQQMQKSKLKVSWLVLLIYIVFSLFLSPEVGEQTIFILTAAYT